AMMSWDPDGPGGPLPPALLTCGDFEIAGRARVNGFGRWDGASWSAFGRNGPFAGGAIAAPRSLTTHGGALIAGGAFPLDGSLDICGVARWDGLAWQPLGSGLHSTVLCFTEYNGALIAGGNFHTLNSLDNIAQWNGSQWLPLGPDLALDG